MVIKDVAFKSFYGDGHAAATYTRECLAMPGVREQTICTPESVIDAICETWPEGISLDPCSEPEGVSVPARDRVVSPDGDGLAVEWPDYTYVNPPYARLKDWLGKAQFEIDRGCRELAMLVPVRTHRAWFKFEPWTGVIFLRPVKFRGYDTAFPAPICILYHGDRFDRLVQAIEKQNLLSTFLGL